MLQKERGRERESQQEQAKGNPPTYFEGVEVDKVGQEGELIVTEVVIKWKRDLLIDDVECVVWGTSLI